MMGFVEKNIVDLPVLSEMCPIYLEEMQGIKLMNRVDTKYVANRNQLAEILEMAKVDYRIQVVNDSPVNTYDSVYFDTDEVDMYIKHHNQKLRRQKIRTRRYVESELNFLEIKNKTNTGRTKKIRVAINEHDFSSFISNQDAKRFIDTEAQYNSSDLLPQLQSSFSRITLVNNEKTERLTIDTNLIFNNIQTGSSAELPHLMVIELKQDGVCSSKMKSLLQDLRIKPVRISKYCVGMVMTNPTLKSNRFKNKIYYIKEKL